MVTAIPFATNFMGPGGWIQGTTGATAPGAGAPQAPAGRGQPPPGGMGAPAPGVNGAPAPWGSGPWGSGPIGLSASGFGGFIRGRGNLAGETSIRNG